jgi:hypothetical protein
VQPPHFFLFASCNLNDSRHVIQAESEGQHPARFLFHRYRRVWLGAPKDTLNGFRLVLLRRVAAQGFGPSHSCCVCLVANPRAQASDSLRAPCLMQIWRWSVASVSVHALIRSPSTSPAVEIVLDPSLLHSRQILSSSQEVLISILTLC